VIVWRDVFLGVIAVATLAIAIAQVGVIIAAGLMARRVSRMVDQLERDVKPLFGHLNAIGSDASRAVALATAQVERADKLFADVTGRIEQTLNTLQTSIGAPAREGRAMMGAFRAAIQALRELRSGRARQGRGDEEDPLFI
jgi:hypothetical protein